MITRAIDRNQGNDQPGIFDHLGACLAEHHISALKTTLFCAKILLKIQGIM